MKNWKRLLAGAGVIFMLLAFCLPMIFSFGKGENSGSLFWGAIGIAFLVPILIYMFLMAYRIFGKKEKSVNSNVENIIFDVGNVLMEYGWEPYLKSFGFSEEKYEKIADAVFRSKVWNEQDRGLLPEEEYVNQYVALAPEYEKEIREVMEHTPECMSVYDYADTWVKYLKEKGYHLYVLSNYGSYMLNKNREQMSFLKYMDGVVFSCEVKQVKPEQEIYKTILKKYNLKPEKTVFIDDRKDNCEGAEKAGIRAIQFKSFKQAAAELEKLGVK